MNTPTTSDSEAEELVIFGLIVHYLGLPENANPDKYNALAKKMVSLMSQVEIEGAIAELQKLFPTYKSDDLGTDYGVYNEWVRKRIATLQALLKVAEGGENG